MTKTSYLAVIRVRGKINLAPDIKKTFEYLNLHNKNWCVLLPDTPTTRGMITKIKDYVTYGELSNELLEKLVKKRGELSKSNKFFKHNKKKYKRYFRLSPPKKGYGRKGIKVSFKQAGALGNRGKKINDLLIRMI